MQATVYNLSGDQVRTVELNDYIFGIKPNKAVMHQALVRQHANARQGTASTKTRAEVSGGGKKPYRQKGTGNARQGSRRAPHYRGGAVIFGPKPRSYEKDMPRKMRRLAVRSALSIKVNESALTLVDGFENLEPKTKAMVTALNALKLNNEKVLVIIPDNAPETREIVYRAAGNLEGVKPLLVNYLNMDDMLKYDRVLMPVQALDWLNTTLGADARVAAEVFETDAQKAGEA
ncbi:MAG TPA: 50S ribosomal protein L4 [Chloroflexia bacterium]|nr:50S ribosomal protein L4 [Chloroflexia bacterium]